MSQLFCRDNAGCIRNEEGVKQPHELGVEVAVFVLAVLGLLKPILKANSTEKCWEAFVTAFNLFLQPEKNTWQSLEAENIQPFVQHQAVHHGPGEALPSDVGSLCCWQQTGPHDQASGNQ